MINGHDTAIPTVEETPADPVVAANQRLAQVIMKLPMTPNGAAISAFVNGTLAKVAIDALMEYCVTDKKLFERILIARLESKALQMEQAAQMAPRLVVPGGNG